MTLKEKYTTDELIAKDSKESGKTIISNEGYAICDIIEDLIKKIERTRTSLIK